MFKKYNIDYIIISVIIVLTAVGVSINIYQQQKKDDTSLPSKIEEDGAYQRWITNLKNKGFEIDAEEFKLIEEEQIYNTKWIKLYDIDDPAVMEVFENTLNENKDLDKVIFSPSERSFIDYRNIERSVVNPEGNNYKTDQVRFFGVRDTKLMEARILECYNSDNCYFDRAFFLSNDVFVVSEFSLYVNDKDSNNENQSAENICNIDDVCEYSIKLHLIDLVNNSKNTYESNVKELNLEETIPEL